MTADAVVQTKTVNNMAKKTYKHHEAKLKCLICGKICDHLGSHCFHKHKMTAREYKTEFELPWKMSLISESVYQKKRDYFDEHRQKFLRILLKSGKKHRFKKGHHGLQRTSEYEREEIIKRIKKVNSDRIKYKSCPVCKIKFQHLESHLFNKHNLIYAKK